MSMTEAEAVDYAIGELEGLGPVHMDCACGLCARYADARRVLGELRERLTERREAFAGKTVDAWLH